MSDFSKITKLPAAGLDLLFYNEHRQFQTLSLQTDGRLGEVFVYSAHFVLDLLEVTIYVGGSKDGIL